MSNKQFCAILFVIFLIAIRYYFYFNSRLDKIDIALEDLRSSELSNIIFVEKIEYVIDKIEGNGNVLGENNTLVNNLS